MEKEINKDYILELFGKEVCHLEKFEVYGTSIIFEDSRKMVITQEGKELLKIHPELSSLFYKESEIKREKIAEGSVGILNRIHIGEYDLVEKEYKEIGRENGIFQLIKSVNLTNLKSLKNMRAPTVYIATLDRLIMDYINLPTMLEAEWEYKEKDKEIYDNIVNFMADNLSLLMDKGYKTTPETIFLDIDKKSKEISAIIADLF